MIGARLKLYAALGLGLCLAIALALAAWRLHLIEAERARAAAEAARDFKSTTERIEDADVSKGDSDDDLRWLDERLRRIQGQR